MESTDNFAYLLPFIFVCFGLVFLILPRFGAGRSTRFWGLGLISAACGFCASLLSGIPVEARAMLAEACFLSAYFSYGQALLSRYRLPQRLPLRAGFWLAAMAMLSYVIVVRQDLRAEMLISDTACATLLAVPLWLVRSRLKAGIDWLLGVMAGLTVLDTVSRVIGTFILTNSSSYPTLDSFFASDYAFVTQVTASVIGFLLALAVLATAVFDIVAQHRHMAEHDALTDLLNRRGFERLAPDFRAERFPSGTALVCDIDHFKQVNDRFGHAAGDRVIIAFSAVLREAFPAEALTARFGGEEFVVYLPGLDLAEAERLANEARIAWETRGRENSRIGQVVTASFGIASIARGDHSIHDAINRADGCLYAAKSAGRNQVVAEGNRHAATSAPALRLITS